MNKDRKFLVERLGIVRTRAKLSSRELSLQIGKSPAYIAKFENGDFSIPCEVLFDAIRACGSDVCEFFSHDITKYNEESKLLENWQKLSAENKETILNLMKNLK